MNWKASGRTRCKRWLDHLVACCVGLTILFGFSQRVEGAGWEDWLANRLNQRLPLVERRLSDIDTQLKDLPILPDLDSLGSHGFHSNFTEESEGNWFQIAWDQPQAIDGIAVIPTRLTTQSGEMSNYGFPVSMRVEAMLPGVKEPVVIAEMKDSHLDLRRGDPVFFSIPHTAVLSLRFIPINLPKLPGKLIRFFSLSELLVFRGESNIAPDGRLSARYSIDAEVGWNLRYLVDGQSPLGPPEIPLQGASLGWHADSVENNRVPTWASIDLGEKRSFDGFSIIAARGDSPVKGPGFGFPVGFRIEVSDSAAKDSWRTILDRSVEDFSNPGYNPVILHFSQESARYVRLVVTKQDQPDKLTTPRTLISELEVLDGQVNLALGKKVTTPDTTPSRAHDAKRVWSVDGLTDGFSSTGRLIPLRRWVEDLSRSFDLSFERRSLLAEQNSILERTRMWTMTALIVSLSAAIIGLAIWLIRQRRSSRRHLQDLRRRISSDLHDEVGSNLATIALLAEIAPTKNSLASFDDISRMARESSHSLREILDLTIAPNRARKPLPERLREIAALMLKEQNWEYSGDATPNLDPEQRRNFIFFIKEALHNVSHHAGAKHVSIHFDVDASEAVLQVTDDGCGLPLPPANGIPRLRALEQRAESLHGSLTITSAPGKGTALTLRFPLPSPQRP